MSSAQENTKIEQVVEAIENFAINIARGQIMAEVASPFSRHTTAELLATERGDAREEMTKALRELLKPTLRIVVNDPPPPGRGEDIDIG